MARIASNNGTNYPTINQWVNAPSGNALFALFSQHTAHSHNPLAELKKD
jgi:hypothetical protein